MSRCLWWWYLGSVGDVGGYCVVPGAVIRASGDEYDSPTLVSVYGSGSCVVVLL